ncbi:MAG: hypothetical protein ACOVP6_10890 [Lacibacter sp.]|jgi:hypothetical protein
MEIQDLKTFEDACKVEGIEKLNLDLSSFPEALRAPVEAATKLMIINKAANRIDNNGEEWKPDWNDDDQWKYYPWFEMGGSSGFRFLDFGNWYSFSNVGSRLCFKERSTAVYIGKQFTDLYKQFMVIE